jgi:hypothetical protein
MAVIIWQQASRRCTVSVSGAAIAVQLLDGDDLVDERAVSSTDQALSLAEAWKSGHRAQTPAPSRRRRPAAQRPRPCEGDGTAVVPRVMWIDQR